MWSSRLLARHSGRPLFVRNTPSQWNSVLANVDGRSFSSDDNQNNRGGGVGNQNNNRPPADRRGGGGGGRGDRAFGQGRGGRGGGRGNQGGRNNNRNDNYQQSPQYKSHGRRPQKPNFAKEVLEPAAKGELKNHQSTVPRTIGKKAKGHSVRGADAPFPHDEEEEFFEMQVERMAEDITMEPKVEAAPSPPPNTGSMAKNSPIEQLTADERKKLDDFLHDYHILINSEEEEKYYWNEYEYDVSEDAKRAEAFERLQAEATRDADGNLVVEVDDQTFKMFESVAIKANAGGSENSNQVMKPKDQPRQSLSPADDPVFQFVTEAMGIEGLDKPPPPDYDRVLPLKLSGPTIQDFVESMMNHPTKYGEVRWDAPNPGRDREPLPEFPPQRLSPPAEFVEANRRFIYVWGLPPSIVEKEAFNMENPLHCVEIQKVVGSSFDVPLEQVSAASPTSAFVGFPAIDDYKFAVAVGPMMKTIESPVVVSKYTPPGEFALAKQYPDALILLENLPLGLTPTLLASSLFPPSTEVGEVYGNLSPDRVVMLSPNSAVVALDSAEAANNAVTSALVQERMMELGQHRIRYGKARRELIYTGTHGGPDGTEPLRTLGTKLIVDGDMPTKDFFTSHASALYLRNLDPSVTKQQIAEYFQPFCSVLRDVDGSTEFVTCQEGLPTGKAFVGFDELGEAEAALEALSKGGGRLLGLGPNSVVAKHVKERTSKDKSESRPARSEDYLLESLNNWQQFVDPEDLQELLDHDISVEALDETFRTIRYKNPTFASMDQAMRKESINPDKESGGMYKELVQTYIATLKECLSTPEKPGAIYESIHFPDEPLDTEIFEMEPQRQAELRKRREAP